MIRLTPGLLARATGCTAERAAVFAPALDEACAYYGISANAARLAAFLAQVGHESGGLRHVRELASGAAYEGRADLGNTQPGDGTRYRGRGLIQTTGRANHARVRDRLRARLSRAVPDFEAEPEQLERPEWAAWSAADYWDMRGLNPLADAEQFALITRRINGGTNGMDDRQRRWALARSALAEARAEPAPIQDRSTPAAAPAAPRVPQPARTPEPAPPAAPAQEQSMPTPLLAGLASTIISLFTPLAAEKLRKEIGRHTSDSAVAEQLTAGVIEAAKAATGHSDPIQAVAAVQSSPEALQRTEAVAMQSMDQLLPLIERINAMEQGNIRAAREFNAAEPLFIETPWVRMKFVHLLSLVFVSFAGAFVMEQWASLTSELKGAVITLMVIAGWNGVRDYWMGSSNGSAEKNGMLARADKPPRPGA